MPRFRKKPVVIEAMKFDGTNAGVIARWADPSLDPQLQPFALPKGWWLKDLGADGASLIIPTLEGEHEARPGDWIIRGVAGEFYPCKPEIFSATYEPAEVD